MVYGESEREESGGAGRQPGTGASAAGVGRIASIPAGAGDSSVGSS